MANFVKHIQNLFKKFKARIKNPLHSVFDISSIFNITFALLLGKIPRNNSLWV